MAERGSPTDVPDTVGPRRERGIYGVYVGWRVCAGCRGGGTGRDGTGGGRWPVVLGSGEEEPRAGDIGGVGGADDAGVILPETTSG